MVDLVEAEKKSEFSFMEITFLTKVERSILNAAGTSGGNLTELKKTTEIDNSQRIFVSGSSMKWSIKKYWEENQDGTGERTSPISEKEQGAQISSACDPAKYIDDDLFGFFNTAKNQARYAPVKTSGMISVFDIGPDIDNLVRFSKKSQNHSLFDKEVSTNVFRSSWAVELDRVGRTEQGIKDEKVINLSTNVRERRVKVFLQSLFNFWQRTQQTNYLTNTQPELMTVIFRKDKSLVVGNKLKIDEGYNLDIEALEEIMEFHKNEISLAYIGSHKSFITNYENLLGLNGKLDGRLFVSDMITLKDKLLSNQFKLIR
jgi:CRISPR-associated protein Cst2